MFRARSRPFRERRDLARGWNVVLFWGGPLAWVVVASTAAPLLRLGWAEYGLLLIAGTAWFGAACLLNALRCGRAHCWIDGTLVPALSVVGVASIGIGWEISWATYLSVFWGILIASVAVECLVGSYPGSRPV